MKIHSALFSFLLHSDCSHLVVFLKTDVWHGSSPQLTPHYSAKWCKDNCFFYEDIIGAKFEFFPIFYHGMVLQSMHIFPQRSVVDSCNTQRCHQSLFGWDSKGKTDPPLGCEVIWEKRQCLWSLSKWGAFAHLGERRREWVRGCLWCRQTYLQMDHFTARTSAISLQQHPTTHVDWAEEVWNERCGLLSEQRRSRFRALQAKWNQEQLKNKWKRSVTPLVKKKKKKNKANLLGEWNEKQLQKQKKERYSLRKRRVMALTVSSAWNERRPGHLLWLQLATQCQTQKYDSFESLRTQ